MSEYVRRYVPCRNPLCWNVVFAWDGPLCSSACQAAWCHANARNPTNGLINPPIVHPAAELDGHGWEHGDIVAIACPDGTTKRLRVVDEPPITHAAGVIPLEVEQAVTAQIDHRTAALQAALSPLAVAVECEPMPAVSVQQAWFAGAPKVDPARPRYVKRWLRGWFG